MREVTELNRVFMCLLFKVNQCLFEDRWVDRRQRRERERVNMWRQKEIYVGSYFFKNWEIIEALEKIRHASSEIRMSQYGRLPPNSKIAYWDHEL